MDSPIYDDSALFPAVAGIVPTEQMQPGLNPGSYGLGLAGVGGSISSPGAVVPPGFQVINQQGNTWYE